MVIINHRFYKANNKKFYFETSPTSQYHYTQCLVKKSQYSTFVLAQSGPISAIESCPETWPPSNCSFTRASPLFNGLINDYRLLFGCFNYGGITIMT